MPVLHVVVPFFNERQTLEPCLRRVLAVELPAGWTMDLYLVDDHSGSEAHEAAETLARQLQAEGHPVSLRRHEVNRGKGAALRTGFAAIIESGADPADLVVIQDADLEYDPADFPRLMQPVLVGRTNVVLGTRWGDHTELATMARRVHALGNRLLTVTSNLMTGYRVTDMECCYKLMTVDVLQRLRPLLTEDRFSIEPQIVAALARLGEPIVEAPVRYDPRGVSAGKKIGWRDAVHALRVILHEKLRRAPSGSPANPGTERRP